MLSIFNFFGNILGYLLKALYMIVRNYGIAIILFTIITKILMFPLSVKQQKSTAAQGKISQKQKELQQKYANNRAKYNEELQALYQKEGVNPAGGCLTTLIPFPIMIGLYYAVVFPLKNVLHYSTDLVNQATSVLRNIPGVSENFSSGSFYSEIQIVKHYGSLKPYLTMFSAEQSAELDTFSRSFNLFGFDLLGTPRGSAFSTLLWIIPVLCLVTAWGQQFYMTRTNPAMQQQQGCMKYAMYILPLITVYFAYTMPAAIGFYWVVSQITGILQTIIIHKYYGPDALCAKQEASRAVLRLMEEEKIQPLSYAQQKQIEEKIYHTANQTNTEKSGKNQKKQEGKKKSNNADRYIGSKK